MPPCTALCLSGTTQCRGQLTDQSHLGPASDCRGDEMDALLRSNGGETITEARFPRALHPLQPHAPLLRLSFFWRHDLEGYPIDRSPLRPSLAPLLVGGGHHLFDGKPDFANVGLGSMLRLLVRMTQPARAETTFDNRPRV